MKLLLRLLLGLLVEKYVCEVRGPKAIVQKAKVYWAPIGTPPPAFIPSIPSEDWPEPWRRIN